MKIRRLKVHNFRGIKALDWILPIDQRLICLIGPGDSGKSSIIDAIHLLLGDRWNPAVADTEFHNSDVGEPIVIRAAITHLPNHLLKETAFGLWLSGIDANGEVSQDPTDGLEPCLFVQLKIDDSLEPVWTVERLNGDSKVLSSSARREFATFKVDDRVDVHLRWTRNSALGRMSSGEGGTKNAMAMAGRAAREALAELEDDDLDKVTAEVQKRVNLVGGGRFEDLHPGLDTSISSAGGNLALYEGLVPLTGFGLGSKRLAGIAVQQLAAGQRSTLLIDEIEHGLEPHRLVRLLQHLLSDENYSQVFITTHSAVAVEQATTESLAVVRNDNGTMSVHALASDKKDLALRLRRSRPSSFLAKRIIVTEGKTEHGLLMTLIDAWDKDRLVGGLSIAAGEGVVVQDGEGGSEVGPRAHALCKLGYEVMILVDNDDRAVDKSITEAAAGGVLVARWEPELSTEGQIASHLEQEGLDRILQLGVELRNDESTVLLDLHKHGLPTALVTLDVVDWLAGGVADITQVREIVALAMNKSKWFKDVDSGRRLGAWLLENEILFQGTHLDRIFDQLKEFIFPALDVEPSTDADA